MNSSPTIQDRYKAAMIPALLMGIATNIYIVVALLFVEVSEILWSPILAGVIFISCFFLLKTDRINAKKSFLIAAYTVVIEVCIHTHFLGWESGFFYFLFLLPTVFLLNYDWKMWMIIFFNSSIVIVAVLLKYRYQDGFSVHLVPSDMLTTISLFNLTCTGSVVFVVMLYFSRTINKKDEALVIANLELEKQNKEISSQHKHQQILLKEIHHRVKNNLQIISSLLSLQTRTVDDKEALTILNESKRRIEAIALIHQKLYQNNLGNRVDFKSYLEELMKSQQVMNSELKCTVVCNEVNLSLDIAVPLGLIISEMIVNSIKHAFENITSPELNVTLFNNGNEFELTIQDNGIGLPENFDLDEPTSLGTEIIQALTDQINARIEYSNENGAKFKIYFQDL